MTQDVPLDYIRDVLSDIVVNGEQDVELSLPNDVDLSVSDWPLTVADVVDETSIERNEDQIVINVEQEADVDGYEIRRINATGGVYVDLRQILWLDGILQVNENGEIDLGASDIEGACRIEVTGGEKHPGERPPF